MFSCPKPPHTRSRLLVGIHLQTAKRTRMISALPHFSPMAVLLIDLKSPSGCRVEMLSSQLVTDTQVFLLFPKMPIHGVYPLYTEFILVLCIWQMAIFGWLYIFNIKWFLTKT